MQVSEFDFGLGETAEMIRDTTARFAQEQIAPLATRIDARSEERRVGKECW